MIGVFRDLGAFTVIVFFVLVHFFTGSIREIHRHFMIKKEYSDYNYRPLRFDERIKHNFSRIIFTSTTFYISASITIMAFLIFLLFNH